MAITTHAVETASVRLVPTRERTMLMTPYVLQLRYNSPCCGGVKQLTSLRSSNVFDNKTSYIDLMKLLMQVSK